MPIMFIHNYSIYAYIKLSTKCDYTIIINSIMLCAKLNIVNDTDLFAYCDLVMNSYNNYTKSIFKAKI